MANNMNQIEFIEALRATTSNTAGTALDLATKALAPEMHMDSVEFIISTAVVAGMIIFYSLFLVVKTSSFSWKSFSLSLCA